MRVGQPTSLQPQTSPLEDCMMDAYEWLNIRERFLPSRSVSNELEVRIKFKIRSLGCGMALVRRCGADSDWLRTRGCCAHGG